MPPVTQALRCALCYENGSAEDNPVEIRDNGLALCQNCCDDHYFMCDGCCSFLSNDNYSQDGQCYNCNPGDDSEILDAGYTPNFTFYKEVYENTLFQGVELEIECPDNCNRSEFARAFKEFLKKNDMHKGIYVKDDGSLDNGFEIVSMPFTSRARHRLLDWYKILKYLKAKRAKSFRTDTCGLHIHVSREALTDNDIRKIKYFFWVNRGRVQKVAGRRANNYCEFQSFHHVMFAAADNLRQSTRYLAVNVVTQTKKRTVEFRIFKGTLDHKRLMGCLQFTEALCEFVKLVGFAGLERGSWAKFKAWIRQEGRFNNLVKHLERVGA